MSPHVLPLRLLTPPAWLVKLLAVAAFPAAAALGALAGQPVAGVIFVAVAALAWATLRTPGLLAVAVVGLALGSSSIPELSEAGLVVRWLGLLLLASVPLLETSARIPQLRALAVPLALLVAWSLTTAAWSAAPDVTIAKTVAFALVVWVGLVSVPAAISTEALRRRAAAMLLAVGVAGTLAALLLAAVDPAVSRPLGPLRGWLQNSNTMGLWAAVLAPTVLVLRGRLLRAVAVLPFGLVILWSASRSAALAVLVIVAIYLYGWRPRLLAGIAVAALVALGMVMSGHGGPLERTALGKFGGEGDFVIVATGARSEAWSVTMDLVRLAPLEGIGFGATEHVFEFPHVAGSFRMFQGNNPGNAYLQWLLETGVVGLSLVCVVLLTLGLGAWRGRVERGRRIFGLSALILLLSAVVESLLTSAGSPFTLVAWGALGLASAGLLQPLRWKDVVTVGPRTRSGQRPP